MADATTVYIFQPGERVPVYHLPAWMFGRWSWEDLEDGRSVAKVACGLAHSVWMPGGNATERAIGMRRDHAELFGRLCKRCGALEQSRS